MAFVIPAAYAVPAVMGSIGTIGGFVMGYYYGSPETQDDEGTKEETEKEKAKTLSKELASFDITKLFSLGSETIFSQNLNHFRLLEPMMRY